MFALRLLLAFNCHLPLHVLLISIHLVIRDLSAVSAFASEELLRRTHGFLDDSVRATSEARELADRVWKDEKDV